MIYTKTIMCNHITQRIEKSLPKFLTLYDKLLQISLWRQFIVIELFQRLLWQK